VNPIGIHAMVLTPDTDATAVRTAAQQAAESGYDILELPIFDPEALDVDAARAAAGEHGLQLACSLGLSPQTDVSSEDTGIVAAGTTLLHAAVEATAGIGGRWLCGVLASQLGRYTAPATAAGRANAVAAIREIAEHAAQRDLDVCLEVVNRYESNLFNTVADGVAFVEDVGADRCWVHLDAYHAVIEEDSMAAAVHAAGDRLGYVHIGQNDRGALDTGTVDIDELLGTLGEAGYAGPITFEAFSRRTATRELADNLAIWRSAWSDGRQLAADAAAYIRARLDGR
jgi:D-psicose/D-tagatose/L-ribulose 3-epimerase